MKNIRRLHSTNLQVGRKFNEFRSGYVTVTTPSGTLTSNVPFHVIP